MTSFPGLALLACAAWLLVGAVPVHAADKPKDDKAKAQIAADKAALAAMQDFVGEWKGVGGPVRGGGDRWGEDSAWEWQFKDGRALLAFTTDKGQYFKSGQIVPGAKAGAFELTAVLPDGTTKETYKGTWNKRAEELELTRDGEAEGRPPKITLGTVAKGKRMMLTIYKKRGTRVLPAEEVGFTRKGSNFGKDTQGPECIITGGLGTMTVSYKGKTYHVCCGGCKTAFEEDPEGELAAYAARKAAEKK